MSRFEQLPLGKIRKDRVGRRLSERRFDFHSMRVSGEETALVQIATSAP